MKIAIVGAIATADIAAQLGNVDAAAPPGYPGAPFMSTLIVELLQRGHSVIGITTDRTLSPRGPLVDFTQGALRMIYCPQRKHAFRPQAGLPGRALDAFRVERGHLVQAIRRSKPDLVHAHWLYEFAWAAQTAGLPHLISAHDAPWRVLSLSRDLYRASRYLMARRVARRAHFVTTVSPYMRDALRPLLGFDATVIPLPLPAQAMAHDAGIGRPGPLETIGPETPLQFVMALNGWGPMKNGITGLRAFAEIRYRFSGARLACFGHDAGPGESASRWAVSNNLADGVEFAGFVPHAVLLRRISQAHMLLHPSREESFGAVLAESMALGVPVIAGKSSGGASWVIGRGGVLADVDAPQQFAAAAIGLLNDPARLAQLGRWARCDAQSRFSPRQVVDQYERMYATVLA